MTTISVQEFQRDPNAVLGRIAAGESILLTDGDRTVAEVRPTPQQRLTQRPYALAKDHFVVPPEFDLPLPDLS